MNPGTITALINGASVAHTTVCGVGERSGNAATEDVIIALLTLYGIDLGIRVDKLRELAQTVIELTGHNLPGNKSIVGDDLFVIEYGIVVAWQEVCDGPLATEVFPLHWELLGHEPPRIVLGKGSGRPSIEHWLKRIEVEAGPEEIDKILVLVKDKAIKEKRLVTQEEFQGLVSSVVIG